MRVMGGWNEAKVAAGLSTYRSGEGGGSEIQPKPGWVELPDEVEWEELSGHQRWYRKNLEYSRKRKERRRRELTWWLYEYKRDECECGRCGEAHPGCLEFHHLEVDQKEFGISRMVNRGHPIKNIRAEIERCVVLCANCHRKEHWAPPDQPSSSQN